MPGDAERGNDTGDPVGEIGGDVRVGDVADTPVRYQASETWGAVGAWGFRPAEVADQSPDLVAAAMQFGNNESSQVAGGAGDENGGHASFLIVRCGGVSQHAGQERIRQVRHGGVWVVERPRVEPGGDRVGEVNVEAWGNGGVEQPEP